MTHSNFSISILRLAVICLMNLSLSCCGLVVHGQTLDGTHALSPSAANLLLTKYCFECHAGEEISGDVALDTFDIRMTDGNDAEAWKAVLDVINSGDMPPEDMPQPSDAERRQLTHWLTSSLRQVAEQHKATPSDGVRRLTRAQYTNSLKDLLGVSVNFGDVLPEDGKSEMGFSNNGSVLQTSSLHIDYWEKLARSALDAAIKTGPRPETLRLRVTFGENIDSQRSTRSGAEVRGYQAIPIANEDFKVEFLTEQGEPVEVADAKARREHKSRENVVGIGMRGSANDRFTMRPEGLLLYSAVPHRETTPKSWQGPSPNLKILFRDQLPVTGDFRMRVRASKTTLQGTEMYREGFISLRNESPAPPADNTITLLASDCESHAGMELDDGVLSPTDLPERTFARYPLEVPEDGLYQIDLVHPWAAQDRMPSLELAIDRFREQQRLSLSADDEDETRITTPVTLAWLKKGDHRLRIGGRFFVGFEKVLVTPLSADALVTKNLLGETEKNQTKYFSATPSLRAFAGTRTDDGMDYRTFDDSKLLGETVGDVKQIEFVGRLENLPMPFFDDDSTDPLANIAIFGIWNDYLVKDRADSGPPVLLKSVEVEAPWFPVWPPKSHTDVFFDASELGGEVTSESEAYTRAVLDRFVRRAFRRPATAAEIDRYLAFWKSNRDDFDNYHQSVKEVLVAVLCSPNFLFLVDKAEAEDAPANDLQFQLASKLSYFLWNSPPDETLLELARDGKLVNQKLKQVDRMLDDPKVWRMIRTFAREWLRIDRHENIQTNVRVYPEFTRFVKSDMAEETFHFLHHVLKENRPATDLIDSDYAMLNQNLAEFYGIEDVIGSHFRAVSLESKQHRGGLLSQGAFLSGHSDGSQAHPIKRAVWLKEKILGETPPPPPPNVPDLDPETPGFENLTLKQQLELHRDKPSCLNCHQKIDPYGVVFQNYDAVGRYQAKIDGKPVDAKSVLPDGTEVDGIEEIKQYILEKKQDKFLTALVEHLFAWAIGRDVRFSDEEEIAEIVDRVKSDGKTLRAVFRQIVQSKSFSGN